MRLGLQGFNAASGLLTPWRSVRAGYYRSRIVIVRDESVHYIVYKLEHHYGDVTWSTRRISDEPEKRKKGEPLPAEVVGDGFQTMKRAKREAEMDAAAP